MNANLQFWIVAFLQRKIICIYFKITTILIEKIFMTSCTLDASVVRNKFIIRFYLIYIFQLFCIFQHSLSYFH